MKKFIAAILLVMAFSAGSYAADGDQKEEACTVTSPTVGTTMIACPTYVVTKDTNGTTICRIVKGGASVVCDKVPTE